MGVSVNLAKVKTNQELMDLMFDMVFPVQGGDVPLKLKFEDVIFVMEDVDAASKVVYARKGKELNTKTQAQRLSRQTSTEAEAAAGIMQAMDKDGPHLRKHEVGPGEFVEQVAGVLAAVMTEGPCGSDSE